MAGLEVAVVSLGSAIVKGACQLWLGDRQYADGVASELVDMFAGRVSSHFDQRKIGRFFDDCADVVAKRLAALLDAEFSATPDNERAAAVIAASDTFAAARLTGEALFRADLDARLVERAIRPAARGVLKSALLGGGGEELYWLVLRESCSYLVEVVTTLPRYSTSALTELLRRDTAILDTLGRVLDRLPERRGVSDFAADYRRAAVNKLDRMELLGVTIADANRRYPLSIAYIGLTLLGRPGREGRLVMRSGTESDLAGASLGQRADTVLGRARRALVIGQAGSGKTTLLQWLAVRSALADFAGSLEDWNGTVPFFLPLRRYAGRDLPAPEEFPLTVGRNLTDEMPPGWVHGLLRAGRALVLVDGVDEMPEEQREQVRAWLADMAGSFPDARYVVTSRPMAVSENWLEGLGFAAAELQPMSASDVSEFVRQWHAAIAAELVDPEESISLAGVEQSLIAAIDADRHLRALAVSPLLCALLCALNRERHTRLPRDRMEIYEAALDMLLERRDRERGVELAQAPLTRTEKSLILQDIALWLIRNGWSDAPADRVAGQVARSMTQLHQVSATPSVVFRDLVERSGLLREPAAGRVDFVHRTFQEYLAAKAAVDNDEIGQLIANAHDDQWREVVVMAAGHAQPDQCAELLRGLLRRGRRRAHSGRLRPLAVACGQTARRLDPQLRAEVRRLAEQLVPPASSEAAEALAGTGELLLDLLRAQPPQTPAEAAASVRAASRIGGDAALRLIASILDRHASLSGSRLDAEVSNAWRLFNPRLYTKEVLARSWPPDRELRVPDPAFLEELRLFPALREVRCDLRDHRADAPGLSPTAFTPGQDLHRVALAGCGEDLDLSLLLPLRSLEEVELTAPGRPPRLAPLGPIPREWSLALVTPACGERLRELAALHTLAQLDLGGCEDLADLSSLPAKPRSLRSLSLTGFPALATLTGIGEWQGLKSLHLFDCPQLSDFSPLAGLDSLERIALGLFPDHPRDLSVLAGLPRLRRLSLMGHTEYDVSSLSGIRDLVITVPPRARVTGTDKLGPGCEVVAGHRSTLQLGETTLALGTL